MFKTLVFSCLQLVSEVEHLLNQQAELADVTGNLGQVKQKIKKLENLDENSQVRGHLRRSLL